MTRFPARPTCTWILAARMLTALAVLATYSTGGHGIAGLQALADTHPAPLAIGSPAPDFSLPGVDGKTYSLDSFKGSKALVIIFTAVHCPTAEVYEDRIKKLVADYSPRGVAFAVIQPNNAKALRLDEMGYTDVGDSLDDMKVRAEHRQFNFPFLYDGDAQEAATKYGPIATPHVFVFDAQRTLKYQGRVDSNPREPYAKVLTQGMRLTRCCRAARSLSRRRRQSAARSSGSTSRCCTTPSSTRSRKNRCLSKRSCR